MDSAAPPPPDPAATEEPPGDPESVARRICLQQLDLRPRSRAELAAVLRRRGVPDDAATTVLDRFVEVGLIDDAALADLIAGAQHRERGLARRAVAAKLRKCGFEEEVIGDALTGIDADDERARAHELVTRRHRALAGLTHEVQARRLVALLARKGYPSGLAYEVVRQVLAEAQADAELVDAMSEADDGFGDGSGGSLALSAERS